MYTDKILIKMETVELRYLFRVLMEIAKKIQIELGL